jgi:hypothetical protein
VFASGQASVFSSKEKVPTSFLIDEAPLCVSDYIGRIYKESRKHKISITTGFQVIGDNLSPSLEKIVLGNSNVKIFGRSGAASRAKIMREIGCSDDDFSHLGQGVFLVSYGTHPLLKVQFFDGLIGNKKSITIKQWEQVKDYQLKTYYREPEREEIQLHSSQSHPTQSHPTQSHPIQSHSSHSSNQERNETINQANQDDPPIKNEQPHKEPSSAKYADDVF